MQHRLKIYEYSVVEKGCATVASVTSQDTEDKKSDLWQSVELKDFSSTNEPMMIAGHINEVVREAIKTIEKKRAKKSHMNRDVSVVSVNRTNTLTSGHSG